MGLNLYNNFVIVISTANINIVLTMVKIVYLFMNDCDIINVK